MARRHAGCWRAVLGWPRCNVSPRLAARLQCGRVLAGHEDRDAVPTPGRLTRGQHRCAPVASEEVCWPLEQEPTRRLRGPTPAAGLPAAAAASHPSWRGMAHLHGELRLRSAAVRVGFASAGGVASAPRLWWDKNTFLDRQHPGSTECCRSSRGPIRPHDGFHAVRSADIKMGQGGCGVLTAARAGSQSQFLFNEVEKHCRFPKSCWKSAAKPTLESRKLKSQNHQTPT